MKNQYIILSIIVLFILTFSIKLLSNENGKREILLTSKNIWEKRPEDSKSFSEICKKYKWCFLMSDINYIGHFKNYDNIDRWEDIIYATLKKEGKYFVPDFISKEKPDILDKNNQITLKAHRFDHPYILYGIETFFSRHDNIIDKLYNKESPLEILINANNNSAEIRRISANNKELKFIKRGHEVPKYCNRDATISVGSTLECKLDKNKIFFGFEDINDPKKLDNLLQSLEEERVKF